LRGRDRPTTAQDLHLELRAGGERVGLTTVYRYLHDLVQAGELHEFHVGDHTGYLACAEEPHQHLICMQCGRIQQHRSPDAAALAATARPGGFEVNEIRIDLYGHCAHCRHAVRPDRAHTGSRR
jgi:Fur family ferric uptake transcriptional regulator